MKKSTVRQKASKKQQREQVEKRRERGRAKQSAFVARKKAEGRTLVKFWVTEDEKKVLDKIRLMLPKLVELEKDKAVSPNQESSSQGESPES